MDRTVSFLLSSGFGSSSPIFADYSRLVCRGMGWDTMPQNKMSHLGSHILLYSCTLFLESASETIKNIVIIRIICK